MNYLYGVMKSIVALALIFGVGSITHYYRTNSVSSVVEPFVYERDAIEVIALFKQDYDWLSTREYNRDFVDWVLRTHSPNEYEPEYEGKMNIDVLHDDGRVAGFVTYYLRSPFVGNILFLEVGKDFRCKGYGYTLVRHAIEQLFAQGVQVVQLLTRATNFKAQRLYNRVGFMETTRNEGFVYYAITPSEFKAAQNKTDSDAAQNRTSSEAVCNTAQEDAYAKSDVPV